MPEAEIAAKNPAVLELAPGTYTWCACGRSNNQPWCDGSHKGCGIDPIEVTITEHKRYALCQCKRSSKNPFCDGTHKGL
jgi:CDGSH-type Zn-finger protein